MKEQHGKYILEKRCIIKTCSLKSKVGLSLFVRRSPNSVHPKHLKKKKNFRSFTGINSSTPFDRKNSHVDVLQKLLLLGMISTTGEDNLRVQSRKIFGRATTLLRSSPRLPSSDAICGAIAFLQALQAELCIC